MKKRSLGSMAFTLLLAGVLFLPSSGSAAEWIVMQGTNYVVEYPNYAYAQSYKAWGLDFRGIANTSNWVHCSVPIHSSRSVSRIYLQVYMAGEGALPASGSLPAIHLYNGASKTHTLTPPALVAGWNTISITLPAAYSFSNGLGIGVNVKVGSTNTRFIFANGGALVN